MNNALQLDTLNPHMCKRPEIEQQLPRSAYKDYSTDRGYKDKRIHDLRHIRALCPTPWNKLYLNRVTRSLVKSCYTCPLDQDPSHEQDKQITALNRHLLSIASVAIPGFSWRTTWVLDWNILTFVLKYDLIPFVCMPRASGPLPQNTIMRELTN
jgi:hypothetical protein